MTRPVDIAEVSRLLAMRIEEVCHSILPLGRREGREWVEAHRKDGGLGDSLRVHLHGSKRGLWAHFASNARGDALDLVAYVLCGGDKRGAVRWARAWLGLDHASPAEIETKRRQAAEVSADAKRQAAEQRERTRRIAQRRFLEAAVALRDTPVDRYLAGRGIRLERLGRQPRSLRFHPNLWNGERQVRLPAMVASIVRPDGAFAAVHRTWLERRADGSVGKALVAHNKMTLGEYRGGAIRLWRGEVVDPKTGETKRAPPWAKAPDGSEIVITEGIEDGLTVALAKPDMRVAVAVSLSNMGALELPPAIATVILCADNDGDNRAAAVALDRAITHFRAAGKTVKIARPPAGFKDLNDALRGVG